MAKWPENHNEIPALAAYINRINGTQVSFRKFLIEEHGKEERRTYVRYRAAVQVDDEGNVTVHGVDDPSILPTESEAKAIIDAYAMLKKGGCVPPHSIVANPSIAEKKRIELGISEFNWLVLLDETRTKFVMVQERRPKKNNPDEGDYFARSYWSDGEWRMMEPDLPDGLPLWKPPLVKGEKIEKGINIMLHEGAKAARYINQLINDPKLQSKSKIWKAWGDELKNKLHYGWIGGAPNPHRTNWKEIINLNPNEVIMVCDTDYLGISAQTGVSRRLRGIRLMAAVFDGANNKGRWPNGFDLFDEEHFPDHLFKNGVYIGPSIDDCLTIATWATEQIQTSFKRIGRQKLDIQYRIVSRFADDWVYVKKQEIFICNRYRDSTKFRKEAFNNAVAPYSDVKDTSLLLIKQPNCHVHGMTYVPGNKEFVITRGEFRYVNLWKPSHIKPMKGDVTPFLEYMEHLLPDKNDRHQVMRWCATMMARPELRMFYGVLLVSKQQGVGKSTLMEKILTPIVGKNNTSSVTEDQLFKSQFNEWAINKQLVNCHEVYSGQSRAAYDKLKKFMTEETMGVNEKYIAGYEAEVKLQIMASSNSLAPLKIEQPDRRWLIPYVTHIKKPRAYWDKFNNWLRFEYGLNYIRYWADHWKDYVLEGEEAPETSMKRKIIEASKSEWQLVVTDYAEVAKETKANGTPLVIHDRAAVEIILSKIDASASAGKFMPKPQHIIAELEEHGFIVSGFKKLYGIRTRRLSLGCSECAKRHALGSEIGQDQREWRCDGCGEQEVTNIWKRGDN